MLSGSVPMEGVAAWVRALAVTVWLALAATPAPAAPVIVIEVQEAIGPSSADFVTGSITRAGEAGASLLVIKLDTPGGLESAMRQIVQAILSSTVPVAVYVSPEGARAASAGTYLLYAAHIAAMAPATTLGAATPVAIGLPGIGADPTPLAPGKPGDDAQGKPDAPETGKAKSGAAASAPPDAMSAKRVHDAAALIRALAQQRGRNAEWAEQAVREAVSLTANEALRAKVIDLIAVDVADLLAQMDGRTVRVNTADVVLVTRGLAHEMVLPNWRQRFLSVIANPGLALILMMLGIYGLLFEFSAPGFGVAGTVGAICLLLGLFALQLLPVNYVGLALILLGLALFAAEALSPSFGVLGIGGMVAFVAGGLLLFDRDIPGYGLSLALLFGLAASSAIVVLLGTSMALRAHRRPVVSGQEGMIGATGIVLCVDASGAWASVNGENWKVQSADALAPGQRVRVVALHGLLLAVCADAPEHRATPKGGSS